MRVFAVYDGATSSYERPFFARSAAEAIRSFEDACREANSPFAKHPVDFSLFQLADFDDVGGVFTGGPPQRLCGAHEFVMKDVSPPFSGSTRGST